MRTQTINLITFINTICKIGLKKHLNAYVSYRVSVVDDNWVSQIVVTQRTHSHFLSLLLSFLLFDANVSFHVSLKALVKSTEVPVFCNDFVVYGYQLFRAKSTGKPGIIAVQPSPLLSSPSFLVVSLWTYLTIRLMFDCSNNHFDATSVFKS